MKWTELTPELIELTLEKINQGIPDREIIQTLGLSRENVRRIKDEHGIRRSHRQYTDAERNDVFELINAAVPLRDIEQQTGVGHQTIRAWHRQASDEDPNIPPLVTVKKTKQIPRRSKYSEPEIVELAFLNPGYGFDRFVEKLAVSKNYVFELFQSLKAFSGGEDDPFAVLQDASFTQMVTREEYRLLTGRDSAPRGSGFSTSRGSGANVGSNAKSIPLPPQTFNWGGITPRVWSKKNKPNWNSGEVANLTLIDEFLFLDKGDTILSSDRFQLFTGPQVGNTPQKCINWMTSSTGEPEVVFCRTRVGSGYGDRWLSESEEEFLYHLMIQHRNTLEAKINHNSSENSMLLNQPTHQAPILLMVDRPGKSNLIDIAGWFKVKEAVHDNPIHPFIDAVVLSRIRPDD